MRLPHRGARRGERAAPQRRDPRLVEAGLPLSYLRRGATPRDRAVAMFGKLGVWDTERNNGVLVYLLLAERAIEIVADRGLNRHVAAPEWAAIAESDRESLQGADFEGGPDVPSTPSMRCWCATSRRCLATLTWPSCRTRRSCADEGAHAAARPVVRARALSARRAPPPSRRATAAFGTHRRCRPSLLRRQSTSSALTAHSASRAGRRACSRAGWATSASRSSPRIVSALGPGARETADQPRRRRARRSATPAAAQRVEGSRRDVARRRRVAAECGAQVAAGQRGVRGPGAGPARG